MNRDSFRRVIAPSAAVLALGLSVAACSAGNEPGTGNGGLTGTLNGAGSSAQQAAETAWIADFQQANTGVTINYDPTGSGAGVEQFLAGGVAFAGSDAYLSDDQVEASKQVCGGNTAFELPNYISPIAVVFNLSGVDSLNLKPDVLAGIMAGKIKKWDDPAIVADNPDAKLPSKAITPVHRSDESGTTANFTDYLHQAAPSVWTWESAKEWPIENGEGAPQTSGVVDAVSKGDGTIGYVDESQAGSLSIAAIGVGDSFELPTAEAAAAMVDPSNQVPGRADNDFAMNIDRATTAAGSYPLVLLSYIIACPSYSDASTAELVKSYLTYVVSDAGQASAASAAGSAPLPASLVAKVTPIIDAISAS